MLFDTHAHYDDTRYDTDRDEVIQKAFSSGVELILNASSDLASSLQSVILAEKHQNMYAAAGVHPHYVYNIDENTIGEIKKLCENKKVVAVGEIGLDYYYDSSPRDKQRYWFSRQIELARELKLPIIVHDRDAHEDCMTIIKEQNAREVGGVFHCYTGSIEMARVLLDNNFSISVGGTVTFKNARKIVDVVKFLPLDKLLIETDCPYLTPEPYRGRRNDSSHVRLVAEKIAEIKGVKYDKIAEITMENGKRLFGIK